MKNLFKDYSNFRPRSAQSAVNGRRLSSSVVSPDKHAMTDPEALTSDPDDDDDDVDDDDEEELVRGTRSQIEGAKLDCPPLP